jgi:DNA ligase D-like protein (predicted 3'-phosphoesterase)
LAIPTEDHPLDYADFEGVIPEDNYGAGRVLIWDRGHYENLTRDDDGGERKVAEALKAGHLVLRLDGQKISGGYALQRIGSEEEPRWLLIKTDDDAADARRNPVSTEPLSVTSGRGLDEIGDAE